MRSIKARAHARSRDHVSIVYYPHFTTFHNETIEYIIDQKPHCTPFLIGSPMLWLPACARARHCIVVLFPKVGKCNQTNDTYTFKQSKILQISLQLR